MELSDRQKSILKVISHFDCLDYPLTLLEIRRWLEVAVEWGDTGQAIDGLLTGRVIESHNGLYFIAGRQQLVELRLSRYILAGKKLARARRVGWWLKFFPWVRAIAVYSSLSYFNSAKDGDIDLFVIAETGRLWSCRFFVNIFLKLFRLRPTANISRDKICLSLMSAADSLDQSWLLGGRDDFYYTYGTGQFIFLYGEGDIDREFFAANNWISGRLPNWQPITASGSLRLRQQFPWVKKIREKFFGMISEKSYRAWQWKILPRIYKDLNNQDGRVVMSGRIIKTHDNDKREKFNHLFSENYNKLIQRTNEA